MFVGKGPCSVFSSTSSRPVANASASFVVRSYLLFGFSQRVARLVGNVDNNEPEFLRETKREFDALVAIQNLEDNIEHQDKPLEEDGDGKKEATDIIIVDKLRAKGSCSSGMDGVGIGQLV